jgi:hypothetical protein
MNGSHTCVPVVSGDKGYSRVRSETLVTRTVTMPTARREQAFFLATSIHRRIHPKLYPSTTIQQQHPAPHGGAERYPEPIRPSSPRGHSRMRRRRVARVHRHREAARRPLAAAPCRARGTGLVRAPHTQRSSKTEPIRRHTSVARTMSSSANADTRAAPRCAP